MPNEREVKNTKESTKLIISIITAIVLITICSVLSIISIQQNNYSPMSNSSLEPSSQTLLSNTSESEIVSSGESVFSKEEVESTQTSSNTLTSSSESISTTTNTTCSSSTQSSGGLSWGPSAENVIQHPSSGLLFKQPADPDTGLSWDGVSPIIYTYADGTTGTEKRDGATYEYMPGMIDTYLIVRDSIGRPIGSACSLCGKKVSNSSCGINCVQFSKTRYCTNCAAVVEPYSCHTCTTINDFPTYCSNCGKISKDGTNGTCVQWLMGDVDCPNCGVHVAVRTCHTCIQ